MKRLFLLAFLAACASVPAHGADDPTATIVIDNGSFDLMRIYVAEGNPGAPYRLGAVEAQTKRTFTVRVHAGVDYSFLYSPLAKDGTYVTDPVNLAPGDTLWLHIRDYLPFSSIFLTRR